MSPLPTCGSRQVEEQGRYSESFYGMKWFCVISIKLTSCFNMNIAQQTKEIYTMS